MQTESLPIVPGPDGVLDVREIPCSIKHGLILDLWAKLPVGGFFILVNGHDPAPLRYQFQAESPGEFSWDYLLRNPGECRVRITRVRPSGQGVGTATPSDVAGGTSCCCSGH